VIAGYDVSQHQGLVDHAAFALARHRFCIVKASEGTGYVDLAHTRNVAAALDAGLLVGHYHFARVSRSPTLEADAEAEARTHIAEVGPLGPGELTCVLDLEWDRRVAPGIGAADLVAWATRWLEVVEAETGRCPWVYTGPSFWRYKLGRSLALARWPLWCADYRSSSVRRAAPKPIPGWPALCWQWTGAGARPDGRRGTVDLNWWLDDEVTLRRIPTSPAVSRRLLREAGEVEDPEPGDAEAIAEGMRDVAAGKALTTDELLASLDAGGAPGLFQPPWAAAIIAVMSRRTSPRTGGPP